MSNSDVYQQVTDRIIAELEKGTAPWVKPWKDTRGAGSIPYNAVSGRHYSGVNILLLWITSMANGYSRTGWLTFKQAKEAGGSVRKGEKATQIVFVKPLTVKEKGEDGNIVKDENGEDVEKSINLMRSYWVFNVEQCDGLPSKLAAPEAQAPAGVSDPNFDEWVARTGAMVKIGGNRASYSPSLDMIAMPSRSQFTDPDAYKATMFHELGHWTGHDKRLDRKLRNRFGDDEYAAEELIAELCSAYLCAEHGVNGMMQHASYLDHWLKVLKADKKAIFTASSAAQKAADFIRAAASQEAIAVAA